EFGEFPDLLQASLCLTPAVAPQHGGKKRVVPARELGLEAQAEAARAALEDQPITVAFNDQRIELLDDAAVPAELRGYVQLALDFNILNAHFSIHQGPFDLVPVVQAQFLPADEVSRARYAFAAVNFLDRFRQSD
ncbi:MAG: hypothetical protein ACNA7J_10695, partial [Wenzhouxiangella sp.]